MAWLLEISPQIDIQAKNNATFEWAYENGHLEVAKWLLEICPQINVPSMIKSDSIFYLCTRGHLEMVKWLLDICPHIDIGPECDDFFLCTC